MQKKKKLRIIVVLFCFIFEKVGNTNGDQPKKEAHPISGTESEKELAKIMISEIKDVDLHSLNNWLIEKKVIEEPLKKAILEIKKLELIFQTKTFDSLGLSDRITADRIFIGSLSSRRRKATMMHQDLRSFKCPKYKFLRKEPLSTLSIIHFAKIYDTLTIFGKIFAQWYRNLNKILKLETNIKKLTAQDFSNIRQNILGVKSEFEKFNKIFTYQYETFEEKISKMQCTFKDFLIFYDAIHRFYEVYKVVPESTSREFRFNELTLGWLRWQLKLEKTVKIFRMFRLLTLEFREFIFFAENMADNHFLFLFQKMTTCFMKILTMDFKEMTDYKKRYKTYFKIVKKSVAGLEYLMKWNNPPLVDPTSGVQIIATINFIVLFLFAGY